ncbi:MAG: aryl-sulfate sulfotransferase [candidate division WOR-3 bacterium]
MFHKSERGTCTTKQLLLTLVIILSGYPAHNLYATQNRTLGLIFRDSVANAEGYTLFAPMNYNVAYLIDNNGMLVHSWSGSGLPGMAVYLCEDGLLLRTVQTNNPVFGNGGGIGGKLELVDWDGNVVWSYTYSNTQHCQHHDAIRLPNGNVLLIAWEYKSRNEAIEAGRDPNLLIYNSLWPDHLVEVDPRTDSIVWEWHVWNHLVQDYDSTKSNYGDPRQHPELIDLNFVTGLAVSDWNHTNGLAYNPELDQIAVSVRQFSEIWVIDHSTTREQAASHTGGRYGRGGDLLYRWGNPRAYRRDHTIGQTLFGQHDIQWIEPGLPGSGEMLVFNNGYGRTPWYSTVDQFVPPVDSPGFYHLGPDSAYGPAELTWQFIGSPPESIYSSLISSCQRLANGNTLICVGLSGIFYEVTPERRIVWKYVNPVTRYGPQQQGDVLQPGANSVFKIRRYPPDYPGLAGRQLNPVGPIEIYPQAVDEERSRRYRLNSLPTVARNCIRLTNAEAAGLMDITGRLVIQLGPGENDLRAVSPGVYFIWFKSSPQVQPVLVVR